MPIRQCIYNWYNNFETGCYLCKSKSSWKPSVSESELERVRASYEIPGEELVESYKFYRLFGRFCENV